MTITRPPDLSGALWPIHLKPLDDELLSSWMVRIARAFYIRPEVFWRRLCGPVSFQTVDYRANTALLQLLAAKTLTPMERTMRTRLDKFESLSLLRERLDRQAVAFCPHCLANGVPYYRRSWRVAFVTICERHNIALLDCCPECGALIRFQNVSLDACSIGLCRNCAFDLCNAHAQAVVPGAAQLQRRLFNLLDQPGHCVPCC